MRNHSHVLRDIGNLRGILPKSFDESNFGRVAIKDKKGEKRPAYLLTRDAFSLLVMGMTGKTAIMWKLRYIEAFNALEKAVSENHASLAREAGYMQGREEALALPAMEAERRKGYLAGLKEGKKLAKRQDRLLALEKMAAYVQKGLSYREIGKILGISKSAVGQRIAAAQKRGFWPQRQAPVQGNLLEA